MTLLAPHHRIRIKIPGRRLLTVAPAVAVIVLMAADLASLSLVKVSFPDDAAEAARAGVSAIQFEGHATPQTAETAFRAAEAVAKEHSMNLDQQTFIVYADGSVKLTAHRHVPTVLFKRLPWLRGHTETTTTVTASRVHY